MSRVEFSNLEDIVQSLGQADPLTARGAALAIKETFHQPEGIEMHCSSDFRGRHRIKGLRLLTGEGGLVNTYLLGDGTIPLAEVARNIQDIQDKFHLPLNSTKQFAQVAPHAMKAVYDEGGSVLGGLIISKTKKSREDTIWIVYREAYMNMVRSLSTEAAARAFGMQMSLFLLKNTPI